MYYNKVGMNLIMTSKQALTALAKTTGYKPEILEKVQKLLLVLEQIVNIPFLHNKLALKGGTALNLFH